jgi:hypothetical protein
MNEAYLKILKMIQDGVISAEEGEKLLDALGGKAWSGVVPVMTAPTFLPDGSSSKPPHNDIGLGKGVLDDGSPVHQAGPPVWARRLWVYPLAGGVMIIGIAGMVTPLLVRDGSRLGWLACTLPLMIFGALVVALASWSRTARWLHVRIRDQETRFNFSLPLPLRPAAWLACWARPWFPPLRGTPIDELILSLADMQQEDVLVVEVSEREDEEVLVYLG